MSPLMDQVLRADSFRDGERPDGQPDKEIVDVACKFAPGSVWVTD